MSDFDRYKPPSPDDEPRQFSEDDLADIPADETASLGATDYQDIPDSARETIIADSQGLADRQTRAADPGRLQETVVTDAESLGIQRHGSRAGFDERLEQVKIRRMQPPKPRRRGLITPGCLATFLIMSIISGIILIVALFLPPLSDYNPLVDILSGEDASLTLLTADDRRVESEGLAIEVLPDDMGTDFGVKIQAVDDTLSEACGTLPNQMAQQGTAYRLETQGTPPQRIGLNVVLPESAEASLIDLYAWDGQAWGFLPAQQSADGKQLVTDTALIPQCLAMVSVEPPIPVTSATLDLGQSLNPTIANTINRLYIQGLHPTPQGDLQGVLPADVSTNAGYAVFPLLTNYSDPGVIDITTISTILSSPSLRLNHSANVATFAQANNYPGVAIDYRNVPPNLRDAFSDLVQNLARALHQQNHVLVIVVPPPTFEDGWSTGGYDWRVLGLAADEIIIRAPLNPEAFVTEGEVDAMLRWGVGEINRRKLSLGLSALTVETAPASPPALVSYEVAWQAITGVRFFPNAPAVPPGTALQANLNTPYQIDLGINEGVQTPYLSYTQDNQILRTYWFSSAAALHYRMNRITPFNMGGIVVFNAHAEGVDPGLPAALQAYQAGTELVAETLSLNWKVYNAGQLVSEQTVALGTPVIYEVSPTDSLLRFEAALVGDSATMIAAGEITVDANAPTASPSTGETPSPQATPTSEVEISAVATPTPSIPPAQPVQATEEPGKPTRTPSPVPTINPPEIAGTLPADFEMGAHFSGNYRREPFRLMTLAGLTWVKIQIRYNRGNNADDYGWQIQTLHENNFKILWGVVGNREDVLQPGYAEEYATFVARLAEIGSNGIEIWNEVNLDREWPTGQIDPALYTQFLKTAYQAIKAKNPNTLVISAALAPTGAEGAFGLDRVWNDDRYYAGLAQAGAAQYMDCVGVHYNEGIISPTLTSGDPRDNDYPTRYLQAQTARAYDPFGGQVPVCYTELGYLTPEGFPPLPENFAWAQNVTLAQQASWLGTAALINAQSGKVRLMIIWNLDFTQYDADPAAGYAIIRPDGSCPACDTLGSLRQR